MYFPLPQDQMEDERACQFLSSVWGEKIFKEKVDRKGKEFWWDSLNQEH